MTLSNNFKPAHAIWLFSALAGLGLAFAAQQGWVTHANMQAELNRVEPLYARQLGLVGAASELGGQLAKGQAQLARWSYPAAMETSQAANEAQQRVRALFEQGGLDVLSIQAGTPRSNASFELLPLVIRVDGTIPKLQAVLTVVGSLEPRVLFEGLTVQAGAQATDQSEQRVVASFDILVLKVKP